MNPPRLRARGPGIPPPPRQGEGPPRPVYHVRADAAGMDKQSLGSETRIRVPLSGLVDENWRRAYRLVQLDSTGYFRYRLELESPTITFTARRSAGSLGSFLNQLEAFLQRVNAQASNL